MRKLILLILLPFFAFANNGTKRDKNMNISIVDGEYSCKVRSAPDGGGSFNELNVQPIIGNAILNIFGDGSQKKVKIDIPGVNNTFEFSAPLKEKNSLMISYVMAGKKSISVVMATEQYGINVLLMRKSLDDGVNIVLTNCLLNKSGDSTKSR
ncbi:hypothetical protein [Photorhabdus stackebrandtii]|uniref:Uncharacterized protein n=1 Tax=Photorhabdus stackebrandtii TaxID=1123042 RepID=A0A7X5QLE7_9GAMM|nr:hypothetical protein [Photorhabdus stackebrandtii]